MFDECESENRPTGVARNPTRGDLFNSAPEVAVHAVRQISAPHLAHRFSSRLANFSLLSTTSPILCGSFTLSNGWPRSTDILHTAPRLVCSIRGLYFTLRPARNFLTVNFDPLFVHRLGYCAATRAAYVQYFVLPPHLCRPGWYAKIEKILSA